MNKLDFWTKVWYGYGNVGAAVKTAVFSTFLFVFYNQVLGLSGTMCGSALFVALLFDALNDPLIGVWSDRFYARKWGRRLPFMLFGGFPFAFFLFCLFIPPAGLSQTWLFVWLVTFAILTRTAQTFFQIPYLSLGAELTDDYVDRSKLYSYGQFFGFIGNVGTVGAGYVYFFKSTSVYSNGLLNAEMYPSFAFFAAILILFASYGSIFGTRAAVMKRSTPHINLPKRNYYQDFSIVFRNQSFRYIIIGSVILMVTNSTGEVLSSYLFVHFWGLKTEELATYLAVPFFVGLLVAVSIAPYSVRRFDKRNTLIISVLAVWGLTILMIGLKMLHLVPDTKDAVVIVLMVGVTLMNSFAPLILITVNSIFADISNEIELESEEQKTGTLFALRALLSKTATGVGSLFAGLLLDAIHFPKKAEFGSVSESIVFKLGIISGPLLAILSVLSVFLFLKYNLDRTRHQEIRAALDARAAAKETAEVQAAIKHIE